MTLTIDSADPCVLRPFGGDYPAYHVEVRNISPPDDTDPLGGWDADVRVVSVEDGPDEARSPTPEERQAVARMRHTIAETIVMDSAERAAGEGMEVSDV